MVEEYRIEQMPELINKIKAAIDSAEGVPVTKTTTGNPIEITDGADATLVKCNVELQGTQSGSGAPSPTNIRPFITISGFSVAIANAATEPTVTKTHTVTLPTAIYHGIADLIAKKITYDWGYIDSYDGEELPGEWISSMDVYEEGTTPTTGASVAYELAEPITSDITLTNAPVESLYGFNKIASTSGALDIEYFTSKFQPILDLILKGSGGDLYSTTPAQVGEWIDGSAIMRVALSGSWTINTGNGSSNIEVGSTYAGKRLLKCTILYNNGYDDMAVMIPPYAQVSVSGYLNIIHPTNTAYSDIYAYAIILEYIEPA